MIVLVTCPNPAAAKRIARDVVNRRLAACVNIVTGVESVFRWEGKVDQCRETLLVFKTMGGRYALLERVVRAQHPYQVPEIIALPIVAGSGAYLRWVADSVQPSARGA